MNRQQRRAAATSLGKSSEKHPNVVGALTLLGIGFKHFQSGRLTEAEACCQEALSLNAELSDALHLMGVIAIETQRFDQAIELIVRAIRQNSKKPEYFLNLGIALQGLGRFDQALSVYDQALILQPDYVQAWQNLADLFRVLNRDDEALSSYDKVLSLDPCNISAINNGGLLLFDRGRLTEALEWFNRAISIDQTHAELFQNRGLTLQRLKRLDDAEADYTRALAINPNHAGAYHNFGDLLAERKQFVEALDYFDRALALGADPDCYASRANSLMELRRLDEARDCYNRMIALYPDFAKGHFNGAMYSLLTGDFEGGWARWEWRQRSSAHGLEHRAFTKPLWLGDESLEGKTVFIYNDEGLGDAIQFCRYIPLLKERGARVILEIDEPLQALLSKVTGVSASPTKGTQPPRDFDFHTPISSLPHAFGTRLETIPANVPYLFSSGDARDWRSRLGEKDGRLRIGIVWSGNPKHGNDRNRSIPLRAWAPILKADAKFISLQKQVREIDFDVMNQTNITDLSDELTTFSDTAELIANLDLVITVDTSVAHLAGALGRPVWILLPFTPDWRWLLDRSDSPWYPTARLFRQTESREWPSVMESVRVALEQRVASRAVDE